MLIDMDQLKVSGHHLFLAERPQSQRNKPEYNEYMMRKYIEMLKQNDIETIVVLLSQRSMEKKYDRGIIDDYKKEGYKVIHYPISDFETPEDMESFHNLIKRISSALSSGNVLIHCGAGIGRTGMVAAGLAIFKGFKPNASMSMIRRVRPGSIETPEQENFLRDYYPYAQMKESIEITSF
jgi:protein tyrosine/serine phosphatase